MFSSNICIRTKYYTGCLIDYGCYHSVLLLFKVTWADLVLAEFTERLNTIYEKDVIKGHSKVLAHMHKVHELPNIKKYVAERPNYPI